MIASAERDLERFIRVWAIGVPAIILLALLAAVFSWPDRWLTQVFLLLALLFGLLTLRQTRVALRALSSVRRGAPERCTVEIRKEAGDARDFFRGRILREPDEEWNVQFASPSWDTKPLLDRRVPAKVFVESGSGLPLVVITDWGFLWAERIPARIEGGG
jgi:hypothetical protein